MTKGLRKIDYLIVGQGLAGTALAVRLYQEGKKILVIDESIGNTSSKKAGGLYNPITGRLMSKTWLADDIFPLISPLYEELERLFGSKFHYPTEIYRPFHSLEELNDWEGKAADPEYVPYIQCVHRTSIGLGNFQDPYGGLSLKNCGYVDLPELISSAKKWMEALGIYRQEVFIEKNMEIGGDCIRYGDIEAGKIVYCQGPKAADSTYWNYLPFKPVKGEILELKMDLKSDRILNRGVFILPKSSNYRVGSNYDHRTLDFEPSDAARAEILGKMEKVFTGDYEVINQSAGVRPATFDRRPFIGTHPAYSNVDIFNGFGTKGVSLVPFFVTQYVNYLLRGGQLAPEADIKRVQR